MTSLIVLMRVLQWNSMQYVMVSLCNPATKRRFRQSYTTDTLHKWNVTAPNQTTLTRLTSSIRIARTLFCNTPVLRSSPDRHSLPTATCIKLGRISWMAPKGYCRFLAYKSAQHGFDEYDIGQSRTIPSPKLRKTLCVKVSMARGFVASSCRGFAHFNGVVLPGSEANR